MSAILDGLKTAGIQTQENSMTSDAAVIWSVLWNGRMAPNKQVYEHYRAQGKPVIIIEIGALKRGITWKVSVNNVTAQGFYGHLVDLDLDRPKQLGIQLTSQTQSKPNIVIALQHTKSMQVAGIPNMLAWINTTISILKNNTDRPITVRPHPRCKIPLPPGITIELPRPVANTYDSFDMQFDCHAVVNYNSGPGIQAAIAGVRPIVNGTSLAYPVGVGFADIEQPYTMDRDLWFTQICHTEYTVEELRNGLWLKRISPALI
jgi:hypothetical protein